MTVPLDCSPAEGSNGTPSAPAVCPGHGHMGPVGPGLASAEAGREVVAGLMGRPRHWQRQRCTHQHGGPIALLPPGCPPELAYALPDLSGA